MGFEKVRWRALDPRLLSGRRSMHMRRRMLKVRPILTLAES